jgi:hypothetical protein
MQPQDAGGGFDWAHAFSAFGGWIGGAITGLITGIWRLARIEPSIRADVDAKFLEIKQHVDDKVAETKAELDDKLEDLVQQFHEAFLGLRQQISNVEKTSVTKDDLNRFRDEYRDNFNRFHDQSREDFAEFKRNISEIIGRSR